MKLPKRQDGQSVVSCLYTDCSNSIHSRAFIIIHNKVNYHGRHAETAECVFFYINTNDIAVLHLTTEKLIFDCEDIEAVPFVLLVKVHLIEFGEFGSVRSAAVTRGVRKEDERGLIAVDRNF